MSDLYCRVSTGEIVLTASGKLAITCCCDNTTCNCCCDTNVDPWYQPVLKITILDVKTSEQPEYDPAILNCLVGEWALPWGNAIDKSGIYGPGECKWYNTFTAGTGTDEAVFYMEATMMEPDYAHSHNFSCLTLKIEFKSCKDCLGNILAKKPTLFLNIGTQFCNTTYPESFNYDQLSDNACGCADESQDQNICGSLNVPSLDPIAYSGSCWNHPLVQNHLSSYETYLELKDPYMDPVPGPTHPLYGLNLSSLVKTELFTVSAACDWAPDSTASTDGFTTHITAGGSGAGDCGYTTKATAPYKNCSALSALLPAGWTLIRAAPVYDLNLDLGCYDFNPIVNWVCTLQDSLHVYPDVLVYIYASVNPSRHDTCKQEVVLHKPVILCTDHVANLPFCDCSPPLRDPDGIVSNVNYFVFPTNELMPVYVDDCAILDDTGPSGPGSCNCVAGYDSHRLKYYCCTRLLFGAIPTEFKSDDYAPIGARYEVLYYIDGDTQSLIYTKTDVPGSYGTYPKGKWVLDSSWSTAPVLTLPTANKCIGGSSCASAKSNFMTGYRVEFDRNVSRYTLHPAGIAATYITDISEILWQRALNLWINLADDVDMCCGMPDSCVTECDLSRHNCGYDDTTCGCDPAIDCNYDMSNGATEACCCSILKVYKEDTLHTVVSSCGGTTTSHDIISYTKNADGSCTQNYNGTLYTDPPTFGACSGMPSAYYDCFAKGWVTSLSGGYPIIRGTDSVTTTNNYDTSTFTSTTVPAPYACPGCTDEVTLTDTQITITISGGCTVTDTTVHSVTYTFDKLAGSTCLAAKDAVASACIGAKNPEEFQPVGCADIAGDMRCTTYTVTVDVWFVIEGLTNAEATAIWNADACSSLMIFLDMPDHTVACALFNFGSICGDIEPAINGVHLTCQAWADGVITDADPVVLVASGSVTFVAKPGGCDAGCISVIGHKTCGALPDTGTLWTRITGTAYRCDGSVACAPTPTPHMRAMIGLPGLEGV